jgi:hypothetical protein
MFTNLKPMVIRGNYDVELLSGLWIGLIGLKSCASSKTMCYVCVTLLLCHESCKGHASQPDF